MKKNQLNPIQQNSDLNTQMPKNLGKKSWNDPELLILSVKENTLGAVGINDDGGNFS